MIVLTIAVILLAIAVILLTTAYSKLVSRVEEVNYRLSDFKNNTDVDRLVISDLANNMRKLKQAIDTDRINDEKEYERLKEKLGK